MIKLSQKCHWIRYALSLLAIIVLAIQVNTAATTLAQMSIEQMARKAPLIVRARCVTNSTGWDAGEIWTFTNFEVEETWRGVAPAAITVRLLGGRMGNLTSTISGVPRFQPSEEVVLFLEPTSHGDFSVMSWAQGTLRIRRNIRTGAENVTQDTASSATFDAATRRYAVNGIRNVALGDFRAQINAALRTIGSKP
jgi:hypothetical protein